MKVCLIVLNKFDITF